MRKALDRRVQVRRVRRTRDEIAQLLADYHSSGLTQLDFVRSRGISQSSLSYWLRTSRQRQTERIEEAPRLVPVKIAAVPAELSAPTCPGFELDLPGGLRLWIPAAFDEDALGRLLPILACRC